MKRLLGALLLVVSGALADDAAEARYQRLVNELRCLVCQNQSISESNAPLAADLRQQVRQQIAAGRSDAEILDYMTQRYGDFVLYRPPLAARTLLLWGAPFVLVLVGLGVVAGLIRRSRRTAAIPTADPQSIAALLKEPPPHMDVQVPRAQDAQERPP